MTWSQVLFVAFAWSVDIPGCKIQFEAAWGFYGTLYLISVPKQHSIWAPFGPIWALVGPNWGPFGNAAWVEIPGGRIQLVSGSYCTICLISTSIYLAAGYDLITGSYGSIGLTSRSITWMYSPIVSDSHGTIGLISRPIYLAPRYNLVSGFHCTISLISRYIPGCRIQFKCFRLLWYHVPDQKIYTSWLQHMIWSQVLMVSSAWSVDIPGCRIQSALMAPFAWSVHLYTWLQDMIWSQILILPSSWSIDIPGCRIWPGLRFLWYHLPADPYTWLQDTTWLMFLLCICLISRSILFIFFTLM